ncbi:hypothetical protein U1Q18_017168 [Sarracenia purpurea var. burkii]
MSRRHESNPHFLPHLQHPPHQIRLPPSQHSRHQIQNPQPQQNPLQQNPQPHHSLEIHSPSQQQPQNLTQNVQPLQPTTPSLQLHRPPSSYLRFPSPRKTKPYTWLIGAFCALFWVAVFLGGLVVLIVYLIFRPRSPKFDISSASLNAAYLDMGYLLNADTTLLANFTNPSKKATVNFSYMVINLYYGEALIATASVEPFSELKTESKFRNIHLVSSQVRLSQKQSLQLKQQMDGNRIRFQVKTLLRTRSNLGSFFRYSYWLYGRCIIDVTGPPSGVLIGKKCITKR